MKNLKIVSSLIALFAAFSFVNVRAMDSKANDAHKQVKSKLYEGELYKPEGEYGIFIELGDEYSFCRDRNSKLKKFVEEDIIKNKNLNFDSLSFNYEGKDLYEFYKMIYNEVLKSKDYIPLSIKEDIYFELFSPEKLKNITVVENNEQLNEILLEYKEDVKFNNDGINRLNSLNSNAMDSLSYINNGSYYVAMLKQIVLIYGEFAKKYGNIQDYEDADYGYISAEMKLAPAPEELLSATKDIMTKSDEEYDVEGNVKYLQLDCGIKFDETSEDILKFYKKMYNLFTTQLQFITGFFDAFSSKDVTSFIFHPDSVKGITLNDNGSTAIFKFDFENIKKRYNAYIKGNNQNSVHNIENLDKIFENFDSNTNIVNSNFAVLVKQIILYYVEFMKLSKVKNYGNLIVENNKENVPKVETNSNKLGSFKNKKFEMQVASQAVNVDVVRGKVQPVVNDIEEGDILFDCSSKDLLKFYKRVFDKLKNKGILSVFCNSSSFILFSSENVEDIALKNDGLNVVFKFNIDNITEQVKNDKYEQFHLNGIATILSDFDKKTISNYFEIFPKQIISHYVERAKKKKEEVKKLEELDEKEDKKEEKNEVVKKGKNIENEKEYELDESDDLDRSYDSYASDESDKVDVTIFKNEKDEQEEKEETVEEKRIKFYEGKFNKKQNELEEKKEEEKKEEEKK